MITDTRTGTNLLQLNVLHLPIGPCKLQSSKRRSSAAHRIACVWMTTDRGIFRFGVTADLRLELKLDEVTTQHLPLGLARLQAPAWQRIWLAMFQSSGVVPVEAPTERTSGFLTRLAKTGDRLWVFSGLQCTGVDLGLIRMIEVRYDEVLLDSESHLRDDPGLIV